MKKHRTFFLVLIVLLMVLPIVSVAQSLKGKVWQSQDTTSTTLKPKTIVINNDGTFYQVGFFYLNSNVIYSINTETISGKYNLIKDNLTLISIINGKIVREWSYKINWVNGKEFILVDGNRKYYYAELGSSKDFFSEKLIVPYLKKAISKNETYDPCYKVLVAKLDADTLQLKKEYRIRNDVSEKKKPDFGKFYGTPQGKTFTCRYANGTITYIFSSNGAFNYKTSETIQDCVNTFESRGQYTSDKNIIHFKSESTNEVECGCIYRKHEGISEYDKEVEWINEFVFRMKIGNLIYLFKASK